MSVDVSSDANAGMPQAFTDGFQIDTHSCEYRGVGVAQSLQGQMREARLGDDPAELDAVLAGIAAPAAEKAA